jgi:cytochrome c553
MMPPNTPRIGAMAVATVLIVSGFAFFMGFYLLPGADGQATLWQRMCRAAGVVPIQQGRSNETALPPLHTSVVVPRGAMIPGNALQIGRGATLALRCTACHGAQGVSGANAPNLAGQYSEVIYKQLLDFKRGARLDAVMGAMVISLTEEDMLDLSHYYAYLPKSVKESSPSAAPALVRVGDPMRSIAPCASCHGSKDGKTGAPNLDGEPLSYLRTQLTAFAQGSRKNDANAVMRGEARLLTAGEISLLAEHYAGSVQ